MRCNELWFGRDYALQICSKSMDIMYTITYGSPIKTYAQTTQSEDEVKCFHIIFAISHEP
jgi:hypothetical protein